MTRTIPIKITGRQDAPVLPAVLSGTSRAADAGPDPFLPEGYLTPTATFDVGTAARGMEGAVPHDHAASADEIVVLELADGSTLITSAGRLHDAIERSHPGWLDADGTIPFEKLRAAGAAPGRGFGEALGGLVSKVFTLVAGQKSDPIIDAARDWLKERGLGAVELGVTWAGTKALMWAVESRLAQQPGLYRWSGAGGKPQDLTRPDPADLARAVAEKRPMLVFVHGTASNSIGSFGELRVGDGKLWTSLDRHFTGGIYALEHRTLSESPIDNALQLAHALPAGACISLVSHSRGGLVADLLCLTEFDEQIEAFTRPKNMPGTGDGDPDGEAAQRVVAQLDDAHAEHREQLRKLIAVLRDKRFEVQRYVRVASPANGTKLASGNFDLFLSGLLTLIGQVPFFFGSPIYAAFKRVVIEIAKNRTNPHLVPGIEAMLPDSPMARLLAAAPVHPGLQMSVIAGDIEGGNLLKRLGVLLTDFLFFERDDNDLVVNTTAMFAGIAPKAGSRVLFDRGADVSHFRYFTNAGTRAALCDWLMRPDPAQLESFRLLPGPTDFAAALQAAARDVQGAERPVVVVLPGVMGSHLQVGGKDRVWFDPLDIAAGGLSKIAWGRTGVEAQELFSMFYGDLCGTLAASHRVEAFPYDWRQPLDVLAERLGEFLGQLMKETKQPIRLLAHSMGGLVVRACIYKRPQVMQALMARDGARLVMLGTPNQGAHSMVENLIGKGDTLRKLVRLDVKHSMQEVLDIVAGFRGALQLLPKPGFRDVFQGEPDGGEFHDYQKAGTWTGFTDKVQDFWFGNGLVGRPSQQVLDAAAWLWTQDGTGRPSLPPEYEAKSVYVFGVARNTPCGVREEGGRLKMVGTTHGDGTVSWESGRIGGIGQFLYMPAEHGDLPATKAHFPALVDLLVAGTTSRLSTAPPATRALEQPLPVSYDAGPPTIDDPDMVWRSLLGGSLRNRLPAEGARRLDVQVRAMDLRFVSHPILVGHYAQDPIAGPQGLIDRELLDGDLSERHSLGLYAGPIGTATAVLRPPNESERLRGSLRGAIVTGLGAYDGAMSGATLTEAVRTGALRYLLQVVDMLGKSDRELALSTLLLGYNSSANMTVASSVEALVRGVMEANARLLETTRLNIRITRLEIVELYIDTAITAVYALRRLESELAAQAAQQQTRLVCSPALLRGEGARQRLLDTQGTGYWPRLIVTDSAGDLAHVLPVADDNAPATVLADSLHFLYVGQRARAESVLQQRQPGLIEQLVRQQIKDTRWSEDFGRMLFQLIVPHDFKDAARQLDRMVLVVDRATANLPWELMLADDPARPDGDRRPMAVRTAVVRQLSSSDFRRHVRQAIARTALVIGNPSVKGFAEAFTTPTTRPEADPPNLPGAQAEAEAVSRLLGSMGYAVKSAIGDTIGASEVLAALYRQPWRILHISAHGVFGLEHGDGRFRSGVLLSGGLLITAAEIAAMEVVPDVVFLNCCHLGTVDFGDQGNKLAASVSRELIEIGVRCVVVAGWAVDDRGAQLFGECFYKELLLQRRPFGDAVFEARRAVWQANPQDITWGAFQAYGDPAWRAEVRGEGGLSKDPPSFASSEEMLDALNGMRASLSRRLGYLDDSARHEQADRLRQYIKRCPPAWRNTPAIQSGAADVWYSLGDFAAAREALLLALGSEDTDGFVPIRDIELLANVEARLGESLGDPDLVNSAILRLDGLDLTVRANFEDDPAADHRNAERMALRGSAYKRKASITARMLLAALRQPDALNAKQLAEARGIMFDALARSVEAYAAADGSQSLSSLNPYLALNRLALEALLPWPDKATRAAALALANQCARRAELSFAADPGFWNAVMSPEALLVEQLIDGSLGLPGAGANFDALQKAYREALANVTARPSELDSVLSHLELLSRLLDVLSVGSEDGRASQRAADRLLEIVRSLQPARPERDDRPPSAEPALARAGAPSAAAPARKARTALKSAANPRRGAPRKS